MDLGGWFTCVKYVMFAFNLIFWLLGCLVLGLGFWIRLDPNIQTYVTNDNSIAYVYIAAFVLIFIGALIMVIGFLGCCGAIRESRCLLSLFFIFLFVIFAALLAVGAYLLIIISSHSMTMETVVNDVLEDMVSKAGAGNKQAKEFMNHIQKYFHCCGTNKNKLDNCDMKYTATPCTPKVVEWLKPLAVYISGVAIGIGIVLLFGMIFALLLCCSAKPDQYN